MKKRSLFGMQGLSILLISLAVILPQESFSETLTASENGGLNGAGAEDESTGTLTLRNRFGYEGQGSEKYAYLRFAMNAAGDTVGGIAVDEITSVTLDLHFTSVNEAAGKVYTLDDNANPGAGFLTETTWSATGANELSGPIAPHGNVDVSSSSLVTAIGNYGGSGLSGNGLFHLTLDLAAFKSMITNSSNDEFTLIVDGPKNGNNEVASIENETLAAPALTITTGYVPPPPPDVPTGLTAMPGDEKVTLDWDDNADSNVTYSVYYSLQSDANSVRLANNLPSSDYVHDGLLNGYPVYYTVTATGTNGSESAHSDQVSATPWDPAETNAPAAPTGLEAIVSDALVSLSWTNNTEVDLAGYNLYRSTTSGSYGAALASNLTSSTYVDTAVSNGITYYYAVSAVDVNGNESDLSTETDANPVALYFAKYTFSDLTLSSTDTRTDSTASDLSAGSGLSTNFEQSIYGFRGNPIPSLKWKIGDCTDETLLDDDYLSFTVTADSGSLTFGSLSFDFDGAKDDIYLFSSQNGFESSTDAIAAVKSTGFNNHVISLVAMDDAAESSTTEFRLYFKSTSTYLIGDMWIDNIYLDVTPAPPGPDLIPPAAPTGLAATAGSNLVNLAWNDNTESDLGSYSVYRSTEPDSGGNAIASGLSTSSYLDGTAENGTTYYYRVAAVDTNGNVSARSTQVSATPTADGVVLEGYEKWLSDNGVTASDANFYEYAMGGDPTDGQPPADKPVLIRSGGSYYYVYPKRSDDAALTYTVEITTNLLDSESWMDAGYSVTGTDVTGGIIDFVTNAVDTVDSETFIRLRIER